MRHYFSEQESPASATIAIAAMIAGTEHSKPFQDIEFNGDRTRMLACIVATADITGQMADRAYLEKLLFLYQEFNEAHFGSFQSMYEMLCQTHRFYEETCKKLDGALGGVYRKLELHFKDTMGVSNNFYLESIEKNMGYLQNVVAQGESSYLAMLKRTGNANRKISPS